MDVFNAQLRAADDDDSALDPVLPQPFASQMSGAQGSALSLQERCVSFLFQAQNASEQGRIQDLRARLEAAREAKPKNFALVGTLGKELKAAEEALASSAGGAGAAVALSAQERAGLAVTRGELVAALQERCEELEQREEFAALEGFGQLLQDLSALQL
jgi:hypothetical protein